MPDRKTISKTTGNGNAREKEKERRKSPSAHKGERLSPSGLRIQSTIFSR